MVIKFELGLRQLSMAEHTISVRKEMPQLYEQYLEPVYNMLSYKNLRLTEEDILTRHQKKTIEEVTEHWMNEARYFFVTEKQEGREVVAWYDAWAEYYISEDDLLYSLFFAYKVRHLDLLDLDDFFNYQLTEKYDNNFARFSRFITVVIRKYAKSLLTQEHQQTTEEWLKLKQEELAKESSDDEKEIRIKGRPKRTGDDKLTVLNQEQTVLLFHYLQKAKVFYHGDFLSNKQAGQAFYILTGYSADTIRQKLTNTELELINTKKNLTDLDNLFTRIKNLISNDIKGKK